MTPEQYKLRDASARPASCGFSETAPSLFLMAGRHPGAWPWSEYEEGRTNKERPARTARRRTPGLDETLSCIPARFCVAPYGGSPLLTYHKHRSGPTCDEKYFSSYVGPLQHASHIRAAFESVHHAKKHFEMCLSSHRLKINRRALVQLPAHWNGARPRRGKIWRSGAPGRNDCLSERSERVSFRQWRAVKS